MPNKAVESYEKPSEKLNEELQLDDNPETAKAQLKEEKKRLKEEKKQQKKDAKRREREIADKEAEVSGDDSGGFATFLIFILIIFMLQIMINLIS